MIKKIPYYCSIFVNYKSNYLLLTKIENIIFKYFNIIM